MRTQRAFEIAIWALSLSSSHISHVATVSSDHLRRTSTARTAWQRSISTLGANRLFISIEEFLQQATPIPRLAVLPKTSFTTSCFHLIDSS